MLPVSDGLGRKSFGGEGGCCSFPALAVALPARRSISDAEFCVPWKQRMPAYPGTSCHKIASVQSQFVVVEIAGGSSSNECLVKERSPEHRGGIPRLLGCRPRLGGSLANITPCVASWCGAQLGLGLGVYSTKGSTRCRSFWF